MTAVSIPSVQNNHAAQCRLQPQVTYKPTVSVRWFASGGITLQELETRVIDVLKAFDKIDPDKVLTKKYLM